MFIAPAVHTRVLLKIVLPGEQSSCNGTDGATSPWYCSRNERMDTGRQLTELLVVPIIEVPAVLGPQLEEI